MSETPKIHELKDISHDIETFNKVITDAQKYVDSDDEHDQALAISRFQLAREVLTGRLFEAATKNPFLHIELMTGRNGIPAHELIAVGAKERDSNNTERPLGGVAAWNTVQLDGYEDGGMSFRVGDEKLRLTLGTMSQTIFEGGRLMVVDQTPMPDEPSMNE